MRQKPYLWPAILGLSVLAGLGIAGEATANKPAKNPCPMKAKETVYKCTNAKCDYNDKILTYYYCPKCNKDALREKIVLNEAGATTIPGKCAKCAENMKEGFWLTDHDTCGFCTKKPEKSIIFCVRNSYACPKHPDPQFCKTGKCEKCTKPLEIESIVCSPIIDIYECPQCKEWTETKGKCDACKKERGKKKSCKSSGEFPHTKDTMQRASGDTDSGAK